MRSACVLAALMLLIPLSACGSDCDDLPEELVEVCFLAEEADRG